MLRRFLAGKLPLSFPNSLIMRDLNLRISRIRGKELRGTSPIGWFLTRLLISDLLYIQLIQ